MVGEHGKTRAAIKQLHSELRFQVGQGQADDRLRAPQSTPGRGKTAFVSGSDERAQLVQRYAVEHPRIVARTNSPPSSTDPEDKQQ
jgi:hypothetical protein